MLKRTFKALTELVFPESCCLCGDVFSYFEDRRITVLMGEKKLSSPYCAECTKSIMSAYCNSTVKSADNTQTQYLFDYSHETVQIALKHIKRTRCEKCDMFFASILDESVKHENIRHIAYIPRSVKLKKKYGFDQSERIIRTFVRLNDSIVQINAFGRNNKVKTPQKSLSAKNRFINAKKSLVLQENTTLPKEMLVFDDIVTTGATAKTAANLLYGGGVQKIKLLFLAKAREITEERREKHG